MPCIYLEIPKTIHLYRRQLMSVHMPDLRGGRRGGCASLLAVLPACVPERRYPSFELARTTHMHSLYRTEAPGAAFASAASRVATARRAMWRRIAICISNRS